MVRKIAEYLGWKYLSSLDSKNAGWYKPCLTYTRNFIHIDGGPFEFVCRNHIQLEDSLSLEVLFGAVEKLEKENTDFGYSWFDIDGKLRWNNVGIMFSMFQGKMDFCMERQLDPAKTISEREINYKTLKEDLLEMICETLNYLENGRV